MRAAFAVVFLAGCGGEPEPTIAYQGCDLADDEVCEEGTECQESAIVADGGNAWCSTACIVGEQGCPAQVDGLPVGCHQPDGAIDPQCYVICEGGGECGLGTTCVTFDEAGAEVAICVPR